MADAADAGRFADAADAGRPERRNRSLLILAAAFVALHLSYLAASPWLHGPDEAEHMQYVEALAYRQRLPVLAELSYKVAVPDGRVIGVAARPTGLAGPTTFQAQHPPLAYLPYAVALRVTDALGLPPRSVRVVGLLWGLLTLCALARLAADAFPDDRFLAVALPALALLPGSVYLCAVVTNDGAGMAAGAVILWRLLRAFRRPPTRLDAVWLGLAFGAGLLIKSSLLALLPVAAVVWVVAERRAGRPWPEALSTTLLFGFIACLLPLAWWLRCIQLYDTPLPRAHLRPSLYNLRQLVDEWDVAGSLILMQLTMALVMWLPAAISPSWLLNNSYVAGQLYMLGVWAGAVLLLVGLRSWRSAGPPRDQLAVAVSSAALLAAMLLAYAQQYLFQDVQVAVFGGRYFLPVLPALGLLLLLGLRAGLLPRPSARVAGWGVAVAIALFALGWVPIILRPPMS